MARFYGRTLTFGYSLSLFLYTIKVSIPFYEVEVSLDFFALFFILCGFYRQSLRGNAEHVFVVTIVIIGCV